MRAVEKPPYLDDYLFMEAPAKYQYCYCWMSGESPINISATRPCNRQQVIPGMIL